MGKAPAKLEMKYPSFAKALKQYRLKAKMRQADLAKKVGVTGPYISLLESEKRPPPTDRITLRVEKALGVPAKTLVRLAHIDRTPEDIRKVTDLDRLYAEGLLHEQASKHNIESRTTALRRIPLINKVAAGYPRDFTDLDYPPGVAQDYVVVPEMSDGSAFAITVCGDSMEPRFLEGDILIISPATAVKSGDFCFVRIDRHGEVTSSFKQVFFEDDSVRLVSLNKRYPPQIYERGAISGIFRAVRRLETL
jgi:phage repressor protein C with HTH and peptisase S24 domain